jgi:inner membrane protein
MSKQRSKLSIGVRIIIISVISFVLMIPAILISNLIQERESTRNNAVREVGEKWGNAQKITGPILTVPFITTWRDQNGDLMSSTNYAHFLPDNLKIDGAIYPEIRYRGIYQAILYGSKLNISGSFSFPDMIGFNIPKENVLWKDAFISLGITDMKGIKDTLNIKWNDTLLAADPGVPTDNVLASGVSAKVALNEQRGTYAYSIDLNLNGSRELNFIPVGKETIVDISSTWHSPSFQGNFLPEKREINGSGFTAQWKAIQLNRNYPQKWLNNAHDIKSSAFGVSLVQPANEYQQTHRSIKYALMFIVLTFASFFSIELLSKKDIHPVQYFLVGLALVLFYTLLLSLSEHMQFQFSYLIASSCTVALITAYSRSMFAKATLTAIVALLISLLYGFLYILLQVDDYALLLGSIGLFVILALFMYLTRKINWANTLQPQTEQV